jgi:L-iditol 2-dehydrogenase
MSMTRTDVKLPPRMKSAVQCGLGSIEIVDVPTPVPGPGQVLVRMRAVGICGSDVHYFVNGRIGRAVVSYPYVLGHEPSGIVAALGSGVTSLSVGARVVIDPALPCGVCATCRSGRLNCCQEVRFLGSPPVGGVFEEYHVFQPEQCMPIPEAMSFETAATLEPMGVALHAINMAGLKMGARVAVMGGGTIGMMTAAAARLAGASFVAMTEPIEARRAVAAKFGVDLALPPGSDGTARIKQAAGGVDAAFEAAGSPDAVDDAIRVVKPGGTVVIIGIPAEDHLPIPIHEARGKELDIILLHRSNDTLAPSIRLVAAGRMDPGLVITHRFPLARLQEAINLAHSYEDGVLKAMILMGD